MPIQKSAKMCNSAPATLPSVLLCSLFSIRQGNQRVMVVVTPPVRLPHVVFEAPFCAKRGREKLISRALQVAKGYQRIHRRELRYDSLIIRPSFSGTKKSLTGVLQRCFGGLKLLTAGETH